MRAHGQDMNVTGVTQQLIGDESYWRYCRAAGFFVAWPHSMHFSETEPLSFSSLLSLNTVRTPEQFLQLLQQMPMRNAVDGVYLVEALARGIVREGHGLLHSNSSERKLFLDLSQPDFSTQNFFHEIGHLILDTADDTALMYSVALRSEDPVKKVDLEISAAEDWAFHFSLGLLAPDSVDFEQFCHACPLRATIMARFLLDGWTFTPEIGWVGELRQRLEFIRTSIATIAQLLLITAVYAAGSDVARAEALTLLFRYGEDEQMPMISSAVSVLDLSNSALSVAELNRVLALNSLESLNLSGTQVSDQLLSELHQLSNLRRLVLRNVDISANGVAALENLDLVELDLRENELDDSAIESLANMHSLQLLQLSAGMIPQASSAGLTDALPACSVQCE